MKMLYFDCFSGIGGDMSVAALLDIGADFELLKSEMERLFPNARPIGLSVARTMKCGVSALQFRVKAPFPVTGLRNFADIKECIECSKLVPAVKRLSLEIFTNLAKAESSVHGVPLDAVHFHEVGAFDSVIDIIGFSIAFCALDIRQVVVSPIALGFGSVACRHGMYPVPAMATLELLQSVPIYGGDHPYELTTPTGAAIIKTIATDYSEQLPRMRVERIGYGAGTRDLHGQPNVLRVVCGERTQP